MQTSKSKLSWILFSIPPLLLIILVVFFDFHGLYGQDSYAYLDATIEIKEWLKTGGNMSPFYWPKGYPTIGALISLTGLPERWSLQLISLLSFVGTLYLLRQIIKSISDVDPTLFLLLAAGTQVYFLRAGILCMSDMFACFMLTLVVFYYFKGFHSKRWQHWILCLVCAGIAFFTRYVAPLIVVPLIAHLFFRLISPWKVYQKVLVLLAGISAGACVVLLNNNIVENGIQVIGNWNPMNIISRDLVSDSGISHHWVPNGLYVFGNFGHIGFMSIGVLLIPFYKRIKQSQIPLFISVVIYLLFLAGIWTQNYRFLVLSHPFVLMLLYPAFLRLSAWLKQRKVFSVFIIGVLLFNTVFFVYSFKKMYTVFNNEKRISNALKDLNDDSIIYTFYVDQSFKANGIDNEVRNLYLEDYEYFESGSLVVYNEIEFASQWDDTQLSDNWTELTENYELEIIEEFSNNWTIYRIR